MASIGSHERRPGMAGGDVTSPPETDLLALFMRCCRRVLAGDPAIITQLHAHGFLCNEGHWAFKLPELHAFLRAVGAGGIAPDYRTWLRQLYASDFNRRLHRLGGEVVVLDNRGKVGKNVYCLRRLSA